MEEEVDLYDEFGNYIGPVEETDHDFSENSGDNVEHDSDIDAKTNQYNNDNYSTQTIPLNYNSGHNSNSNSSVVVLNEDKKYFPSAMEIYGESVQVLVEDEDAQALTEPIIAPIKEILIDSVAGESYVPVLKYSLE